MNLFLSTFPPDSRIFDVIRAELRPHFALHKSIARGHIKVLAVNAIPNPRDEVGWIKPRAWSAFNPSCPRRLRK